MAPWIISALRLLAGGVAFGLGTELIAGGGGSSALTTAAQLSTRLGGAVPTAIVHPGDPHDILMHRRRRRRRRALTASDKADIAFIAGILGKAAGGRFAVALGARAR